MSMELIGSKLPLDAARRVDALCQQFERAWRGGERPRLEEFLEKIAAGERAALFEELLRLEVELRLTSSDAATSSDLCRRFPQEKQQIIAVYREIADGLPVQAGGLADRLDLEAGESLTSVGRYQIDRLLGEGAFGRVYLATDAELHRTVAVKVSHKPELGRPTAYDVFLGEARILARLDHPAIVPVYDVGRIADGRIYIVTKLIEGATLAERLAEERPRPTEAAEWIATAAEALHSAHEQGLVHRDIKPSNLLIDSSRAIYVGDFGLALCEENYGKGPTLVGTPAYMSPEQARGEGHRVDPRSDVFSLGVVLYELLTGQRPFRADTRREILEQILIAEPRPPRQLDRKIPRDLERVCLRAMSKRAGDRFESALELAGDLRRCLHSAPATPPKPTPATCTGSSVNGQTNLVPLHVVPKGLRSFEAEDADFFPRLLPGPRDFEGLPKGIQFWRRRIENSDDETFAVGLLYGPSGCGKSSLIKAGLLPRLAGHVVGLTLEASADDTEARLLRLLHRRFPLLEARATLPEAFAALRRGEGLPRGKKLFLVVDQFEQWLHARADYRECELTRALRQCDSGQLQCLLLIRDDFWLAANRFMQELEIPILENHNSALVDLFDLRHARHVLAAFGQAHGALAENPADWTRDQQTFLDRAVAGLAQDSKVICVRLALFAEMVKSKPWCPAFLVQAGGPEGIGEAFLEEVFASRSAPAEHRLHVTAARAVLRALLPEEGVDIKGHLRTAAELREVSGYAHRPADFESLVALLDTKLHLMTPVESAGEPVADGASHAERCYQLTHDYLVPSLRAWLTRKQRETRRGRAELCLAERAAWWSARPNKRHFPTAWEWLAIRLRTRRRRWTETERRMMRGASRYYLRRAGLFTMLFALLSCGALCGFAFLRATNLLERLAIADTKEVPAIVAELGRYRYWIEPRLAAIVADPNTHDRQRLHASLALLPYDAAQLDSLRQQLVEVEPAPFLILRDALYPYRAELVSWLWDCAEAPSAPDEQRLRAACALGAFARDDGADGERWRALAPGLANQLVDHAIRAPSQLALLIESVRPARNVVVSPLLDIFRDAQRSEPELLLATSLLLELAGNRPDVLAELLFASDAKRFATVFPAAAKQAVKVVPILEREISRLDPPAPTASEEEEQEKDRRAQRQANAAIALLRLGHKRQVWPLLRHRADPRLRTFIGDRLASFGVAAGDVVARLAQDTDASSRRALLLSLGEYAPSTLPQQELARCVALVQKLFQDDSDAGVHGSAEWLLRRWGREDLLRAISPPSGSAGLSKPANWYLNGQGHTMVVVSGPADFAMDILESRVDKRERRPAQIRQSFAIASKEVTMAQYSKFTGQPNTADSNLVQAGVSWYDAARYCNWLSETEGIPPEQWCYLRSGGAGEDVMEAVEGGEDRAGYRLPTEVEWDYACRAGSITPRFYGNSTDLLPKYAWFYVNSEEQRHPPGLLKPNDWGLFDTYGNLWEWCHDAARNAGTTAGRAFGSEYMARGAPYTARPWFLYSSWSSSEVALTPDELFGFRIARTMPAGLVSDKTPERTSQAAPAEPSLHVIRSGVYTFNTWHQQTGVRKSRPARGDGGGIGFRVARTEK